MTMPQLLRDAGHDHISEREGDGSWEDCLWDTGLEWYRLTQDRSKPATHAEAQLLRAASGEPATGGSNMGNFREGVRARYGRSLPAAISGWSALQAALKPGYAAIVTGSMRAFEYTDPLSKWDPSYEGPHASLAANVGGTYYWCDPLAPETAAVPVVITPIELRAFVEVLPGAVHLVARILQEEPMLPFIDSRAREVTLRAGAPLYDEAGRVVRTLTSQAAVVAPFISDATYSAVFASVDGKQVLVRAKRADIVGDVRLTKEVAGLIAAAIAAEQAKTAAKVAAAIAAEQAKVGTEVAAATLPLQERITELGAALAQAAADRETALVAAAADRAAALAAAAAERDRIAAAEFDRIKAI